MIDCNIQTALNAGQQLAEAKGVIHHASDDASGSPFLLVDGQIKTLDHLLAAPRRRKAKVTFKDLASFIEYVNEFKRPTSKIFANFSETGGSFTAALDWHGVEAASHVEDIAVYACPTTPEWNAWLEKDAKLLAQVDFAHFVESHRAVFVKPTGGTMLDIARTLEGKTEHVFKSGANLTNGDRELIFSEATNATAGRGEKIPIPSSIDVRLQPFFHGESYTIEALLRYRITSGAVAFAYELQKVHEIIDAALQQIRNEITEKTQITPYIGTF